MKILHTSDWHLGASFNDRKRYDEFEKTLNWLIETIKEKEISAVIIAGDVFDSTLPSNKAQELYYNFLCDASAARVKYIVVTAGNHDSPSFLDAPKALLKRLNVIVSGRPSEQPEDAVIPLEEAGKIKAVICSVPYLRNGDIRSFESGESLQESETKKYQGIMEYYRRLVDLAKERYPEAGIIATGHLFATGGKTASGQIAGTLSDIAVNDLPQEIDYLALGHLHLPQTIGGKENYRYSGSLLNMNFGSTEIKREVLILDTENLKQIPERVEVPEYQKICTVSGTMDEIKKELESLKKEKTSYWIRVINKGSYEPALREKLAEICKDSPLDIISYQNAEINPEMTNRYSEKNAEFKFTPENVFTDLLAGSAIEEEKQEQLKKLFTAILSEVKEFDSNKE